MWASWVHYRPNCRLTPLGSRTYHPLSSHKKLTIYLFFLTSDLIFQERHHLIPESWEWAISEHVFIYIRTSSGTTGFTAYKIDIVPIAQTSPTQIQHMDSLAGFQVEFEQLSYYRQCRIFGVPPPLLAEYIWKDSERGALINLRSEAYFAMYVDLGWMTVYCKDDLHTWYTWSYSTRIYIVNR